MKKTILLPLCVLLALSAAAQTPDTPKKLNRFKVSIGPGFADGLIFIKRSPPAFGIGYERILNRRFSLAAHMLTYYHSEPDAYILGLNEQPVVNKFRGSNSPFFKPEEKEKLAGSGLWPKDPAYFVKFLVAPFDAGFVFYPLNRNGHRFGINTAFAVTYETHSWYKSQLSGTLTLKDGKQTDITLSIPVEYRDLSAGMSLKLSYDYAFRNCFLGGRIGNYNVLLSDWFDANQVVWDASIFFGFQF
jgi:hypothetical protein